MRTNALLEEMLELARRRGIVVRREALAGRTMSAGGLCKLRGVDTVFIDERASAEAQLEVLASALRHFDWSTTFLPPHLRARISPRET